MNQYPLERPHRAVSPLFGSLCNTHLKPFHFLLHLLPTHTMRRFPVLLSAGRRINCPRNSSHLLSFLKRFFKFSRNKAPDGRLPALHSGVMSGNGFPSTPIPRLSRGLRFFRLLSPRSHRPRLHSACLVLRRKRKVTDCPSMPTLSTHLRYTLSAGGVICSCRVSVDKTRAAPRYLLVKAYQLLSLLRA